MGGTAGAGDFGAAAVGVRGVGDSAEDGIVEAGPAAMGVEFVD